MQLAGESQQRYDMIQSVYKEVAPPEKIRRVEKVEREEPPLPPVPEPQPVPEPEPLAAIVEIREPDWGDHVYVYLRTKASGDLLMGLLFLGVLAIGWIKWNKKIKGWVKEWLKTRVN